MPNQEDEDERKLASIENDDDDDEDDDDWSRQVETDEGATLLHPDDSFRMEAVADERPRLPELTMKERLVLRERQRRIETERARLKQQFALSNQHEDDEQPHENSATRPASVAGTLGEESTRAHPDEEESSDQLGFNMERFLRNSDTFNPPIEPTASLPDKTTGTTPVVMERFLNEPVLMDTETATAESEDAHRTVSFDLQDDEETATTPLMPTTSEDLNNMSVQVEPDVDDDDLAVTSEVQQASTASDVASTREDQPRVLRLTEEDMQEMAAIDEVSIGNAPPSEREEDMLSEVGELADFGHAGGVGPTGTFSEATPTTAMESASVVSGNHSTAQPASAASSDHAADHHSLDEIAQGKPNPTMTLSPHLTRENAILEQEMIEHERGQQLTLDHQEKITDDGQIVNRRIRPGMMGLMAPPMTAAMMQQNPPIPTTPVQPVVVDDFDFDKEEMTPKPETDDSYRDLPGDDWSPKIQISPILQPSYRSINEQESTTLVYAKQPPHSRRVDPMGSSRSETEPLLGNLPPKLITTTSNRENGNNLLNVANTSMLRPTDDNEDSIGASEKYQSKSTILRAFPERFYMLFGTLLMELPVFAFVWGSSESVCQVIGRRKTHLLIAFTFLVAAIAGSAGTKECLVTRRAITHHHVTRRTFLRWVLQEFTVLSYLGMAMGLIVGLIAYFIGGRDFSFGLAMFFAQFFSITLGGIACSYAPIAIGSFLRHETASWAVQVVAASQDLVTSALMWGMAYTILRSLGAKPIDTNDTCGFNDADL